MAQPYKYMDKFYNFTVMVSIKHLGYYPPEADIPHVNWEVLEAMTSEEFQFKDDVTGKLYTDDYKVRNKVVALCKEMGYEVIVYNNNL